MAKPPRDYSSFTTNTYFITSRAFNGQALFQPERVAMLLIETLLDYRNQRKFLLHEFVVIPNHIHVLTTVENITLQRAAQFIKGGFSHRAAKQLEMRGEIWQRGYVDHRIRDARDFGSHREYIWQKSGKAAFGGISGGVCLQFGISEFRIGRGTAGAKAHLVASRQRPD